MSKTTLGNDRTANAERLRKCFEMRSLSYRFAKLCYVCEMCKFRNENCFILENRYDFIDSLAAVCRL
jgi:predicted choloylglycine hydrolase